MCCCTIQCFRASLTLKLLFARIRPGISCAALPVMYFAPWTLPSVHLICAGQTNCRSRQRPAGRNDTDKKSRVFLPPRPTCHSRLPTPPKHQIPIHTASPQRPFSIHAISRSRRRAVRRLTAPRSIVSCPRKQALGIGEESRQPPRCIRRGSLRLTPCHTPPPPAWHLLAME